MIEEQPASPPEEQAQVDAQHPWPGLPAFREADQLFFFGRGAEADDLLERVELNHLTILYGASGLGKSSLLQAGLFPRLRQRDFLPVYLRFDFAPGASHASSQIVNAIRRALVRAGAETTSRPTNASAWESSHREDLRFGSDRNRLATSAWEYLHRKDVRFYSDRNRLLTPVLVVDQFEEAFRLGGEQEVRDLREGAVETIVSLAEGGVPPDLKDRIQREPELAATLVFSEHRYRVVLSLREDYLPDLDDLRPRMPSVAGNRKRLGHLLGSAAAIAVFEAGEQAGLVEPDVAILIVRFVGESETGTHKVGPESLPIEPALLSVICRELNHERIEKGAPSITREQLARDKGEILRRFYEKQFLGISTALRVFVEDRLVSSDGVRELVTRQTVLSAPGVTEAELDTLIDRRVLRQEERDGRRLIELTHDRLAEVARASRDERFSGFETEKFLRSFYDKAIADVPAALRDLVETQLVLDGGLRQAVAREALLATPGVTEGDLNALIERRLLRVEEHKGSVFVELAHDRLAAIAIATRDERRQRELLSRTELEKEVAEERRLRAEEQQKIAGERLSASRRQTRLVAVLLIIAMTVAGVAAWQWVRAQRAIRQVRLTLAVASFREGAIRASQGKPDEALAFLARAMRLDRDLVGARALSLDLVLNGRWPAQVMPHGDAVSAVAWSPDGTRVATGSKDKTARVWDARTGQAVGAVLQHRDAVTAVAWSPDGTRVATASIDTTARVWDARTGQAVGVPLRHGDSVNWVAWSPDGTHVATASADKTARTWDARTGQPVGGPLQHGDLVHMVAWSPDGTRVATASADTARLWDARTGQAVGGPLQGFFSVDWVGWSPDGTHVATASAVSAQVWDARTGQKVGDELLHRKGVTAVAWSPDGTRVATAGEDGTVRLWDARTGHAVGVEMQHGTRVVALVWSPDGTRVATASGATAQVWDARTGQAVGAPLTHGNWLTAVAWSPDGTRVATASSDRTARVWDARTGQSVCVPLVYGQWSKPLFSVGAVAWSPNGTRVATVSDDTVREWDAQTGQAVGAPLQHGNRVIAVAWNPDGTRLATASDDKTARVWDAQTGQAVGPPLQHAESVIAVAWSPDGTRVATASADKTARVWDARTGQAVGAVLQHTDAVIAARWSPDGSRVATASFDKTARVWDARTGQAMSSGPLQHSDVVSAVAWSPDGTRVATASRDYTAQVWDARTGQRLGAPLRHGNSVFAVAWSPDGTRVLTASVAGQVWDARTGQAVGAPLQHAGVEAVSWSPDGTRVATASADETARVWDARTGQAVGAPLQSWLRFGDGITTNAVAWSPDGTRVATASLDTARLWDALTGLPTDAPELANVSEMLGGLRVNDDDATIPVADWPTRLGYLLKLKARVDSANAAPASLDALLRWFFADPRERTISPLSAMLPDEYIRRLLMLGPSGRAEAERNYPGHPLLRATSEAAAR